jgi:hypothetical protein
MATREDSCSSAAQDDEHAASDCTDSNRSPNAVFPLDSYRSVYHDLHETINWTIQFPLVTECIEATEEILGGISR